MTRVLVSRQPDGDQPLASDRAHPGHGAGADPDLATDHERSHDPGTVGHDHDRGGHRGAGSPRGAMPGLQERLRAAMALLPPALGGAPSRPLDVGRTTRVVQPAQRMALAVRDRGCVFPGCDRPLAWCDAHHLWHWIDGGPTDLDNLALLCRAHHRSVHDGGWQLTHSPDGRFTAAAPPHRRHRGAG